MAADAVLDQLAEQEARFAEAPGVEAALDVLGVAREGAAQVGKARVLALAVALELLRTGPERTERQLERGPVLGRLEALGRERERERHAERCHDLRHDAARGRSGRAARRADTEPRTSHGAESQRPCGRESDPSHRHPPGPRVRDWSRHVLSGVRSGPSSTHLPGSGA